jgi:hypothetical protein
MSTDALGWLPCLGTSKIIAIGDQSRFNEAAVVAERKWQFKTKFRAKAYAWRGSRLASRL